MNCDHTIIEVLRKAGPEGLKAEKVARHVFNACNSFFNQVDYEEVHRYVSAYLIRNSHRADSIIARADVRGYYRLNLQSPSTRQLLLQFGEETETPEPQKPQEDLSLDLFA